MLKRLPVMFLALLFTVSLLSACGSKNADQSGSDQPADSAKTEAAGDHPEGSEHPEHPKDSTNSN